MDPPEKGNKIGAKHSQSSLIESDFIQDRKTFEFRNGDSYDGEYLARKSPLSIVREGKGKYLSSDGTCYEGRWSEDLLEEADAITFPDKSSFVGTLENMSIEGPGVYSFKEGVEIHGYLINSQFVGDMKLKDPTGHYWTSLKRDDSNEIFFGPLHPFWKSLTSLADFLPSYDEDNSRQTERVKYV